MKIECSEPTRPVTGPLIIYLDSSDYSDLSSSMNGEGKFGEIFRRLCHYIDLGLVEIRFSVIHVVEIAHLDTLARNAALRRAECIQRLTNGKCFPYWSDIPVIECRNLLEERPIYDGIYLSGGAWHPDLSGSLLDIDRMLADSVRDALKRQPLTRPQRKSLERQFIRYGRLTRAGALALKQDPARGELLRQLSREFPLSDRFFQEDMLLNCLAGRVSRSELVREMSVVFRDITTFIGWTYDTRDRDKKMVKWLRDFGGDLRDMLMLHREKIVSIIPDGQTVSDYNSFLVRVVRNRASEARTKGLQDIRREMVGSGMGKRYKEDQWGCILNSSFGSVPSRDFYIAALFEHVVRNIRMCRKPKASDAGDLFHLSHLPYCHIFRADGDAAEMVKRIAPAYGTFVVPKLNELPDTIEKMLGRWSPLTEGKTESERNYF